MAVLQRALGFLLLSILFIGCGSSGLGGNAWDPHPIVVTTPVPTVSSPGTPPPEGPGPKPVPSPGPRVQSYSSQHVFVLMLENRSDAEALHYMPYLSGVTSHHGLGTQVYSASHGSWLAYGEMVGGIAPLGGEALHRQCNGYGCKGTVNAANLVRQLNAEGKSWKGYFQGIPYNGFMGVQSGNYVRRHNPFPFFSDVAGSQSERDRMVKDSQLATDIMLNEVANYNFIAPDLMHDGHNPGNTASALSAADNYLAGFLPVLLESSYFQPGGDGVLIVTFDESDLSGDNKCGTSPESNRCGGHIFTAIVGPNVKASYQSSSHHTQRDILRTTCDLLGLNACPGDGANGVGMAEFFQGH